MSVARIAKAIGTLLLWLVVMLCLAITLVPRFLDARYYQGPVSAHFDGQRFFNPDGDDDVVAASGSRRATAMPGATILRYVFGVDRRPAWPGQVAIHPVAPAARVDGQSMVVTWIGHSSVLVQTQGLNILTDPVWSHVAGPFGIGPARVTAPGIAFERLPKIDVVLISHDHYDHLDLPTLRRLWARDHPLIVTSLGNDGVIAQAGARATALDWGGRVAVRPGVEIIVTRAHHWGTRWLSDRDRTLWSGFVVRLPGGNVFFAGDTGAGDLAWADQAASYGPVRLALIPIGAFRFTPGQMRIGSHIGPLDAAEVYRRLGASTGIGVHWGTFRQSYEAYDTPPRLLAAVTQAAGLHGFGTVPIGRPTAIAPYVARPRRAPIDEDALSRRLPGAALALP